MDTPLVTKRVVSTVFTWQPFNVLGMLDAVLGYSVRRDNVGFSPC